MFGSINVGDIVRSKKTGKQAYVKRVSSDLIFIEYLSLPASKGKGWVKKSAFKKCRYKAERE